MAVAEIPDVNRSQTASPVPPARQYSNPFPPRVLAAAVVLTIECLAYARFPDHRLSQHLPTAPLIAFCLTLCFFARPQLLAAHLDDAPISPRFLLLHALAAAAAVAETLTFTHIFPPRTLPIYAPQTVTGAIVWTLTAASAVYFLAAAFFPVRRFFAALGRSSWLFAALIAAASFPARAIISNPWNQPDSRIGIALQTATIKGVQPILRLFYPTVISIPSLAVVGTSKFRVVIAGNCSGIEGLVLMLAFTIGWIIYARRELRLARALLLVPIALLVSWILNLVRIAVLIAIGNAGHPQVAIRGFHSVAGWILFNAIALIFLLAAEHIPWFRRPATSPTTSAPDLYDRNPAAPYLLPFLAVLATSLLTRAASSGFEAFYPVRFAVALATLFYFRADYRRLYLQSQGRFGWLGPIAGVVIFAFWLPLAHLTGSFATPSPLAHQLALLPTPQRIAWIAARAAAAILTVPIVEELAFRGYLARRIQSPDVDSIPFASLTFLSILISSVAFGALHGSMWIAGILSGLIFALVAKFSNRLGEAIAAHATANLLITLYVLTHHDYSLW